MPLDGVKEKCKQCSKKCKQWQQITIVHCPNFKTMHPAHIAKCVGSPTINANQKVGVGYA